MSDRITQELRVHLIAQGIVRDPDVAGALPPLWLSPRDGMPGPNEGDPPTAAPVVLAAYRVAGIPPRPWEGYIRNEGVDIQFRSMTVPAILDLSEKIRREVSDRNLWQMGAILVQRSRLYSDLQPIVDDDTGFRYRVQYLVDVRDEQWPANRGWGG